MAFSKDVERWIGKTQARIENVPREAAQDLIEEAVTPRQKGGYMPVVSSNLRNSTRADVGSLPSGPAENNTSFQDANISLAINRFNPGDVLYIGWTARYARAMEARYKFMRRAAQNWDKIVLNVVRRVRGF